MHLLPPLGFRSEGTGTSSGWGAGKGSKLQENWGSRAFGEKLALESNRLLNPKGRPAVQKMPSGGGEVIRLADPALFDLSAFFCSGRPFGLNSSNQRLQQSQPRIMSSLYSPLIPVTPASLGQSLVLIHP